MKKILLSAVMASLLVFTSNAYAACEQSEETYYVVKDGSVTKKTGERSSCGNMNGAFTSMTFSEKLLITEGSRNNENGDPVEDYFEFNANGVIQEPVKFPRPNGVPKEFTCYTTSSLMYGYCVNLY